MRDRDSEAFVTTVVGHAVVYKRLCILHGFALLTDIVSCDYKYLIIGLIISIGDN